MKLRKKQMKLRKNEIISPKSFSAPHRIIRDTYQGIYDFLHREVDEVTIYNVSPMDWLLAVSYRNHQSYQSDRISNL